MQDLQKMMSCLNAASRRVGFGTNLEKNKVMFNELIIPDLISVKGIVLEVVQEYVYLRQKLQLGRENF